MDRNRAPSGSRRANVPPPSQVEKVESRVFRLEQERDTGGSVQNTQIVARTFKTAVQGRRIEITATGAGIILFVPSALPDEFTGYIAGWVSGTGGSRRGRLDFLTPSVGGGFYTQMYLYGGTEDGTSPTKLEIYTTQILISASPFFGTTHYLRPGPFAGASTQLAMVSPLGTGTGAIKVQDGVPDKVHVSDNADANYITIKALKFETSPGPTWSAGNGSPEGAVSAVIGSLYSRTDGAFGSSFYVKEGGGSGNTGWAVK